MAHRVESLRCEGSDAIGAKRTCRERRERVDLTKMSSRAEEFHLRALPEPYVNRSIHTAPDVRPLLNGFASSTGSSRYRLAHDLG